MCSDTATAISLTKTRRRRSGLGFSVFLFLIRLLSIRSIEPVRVLEWPGRPRWRPRVLGRPRCRMCVEAPREYPQMIIYYDNYYIIILYIYCVITFFFFGFQIMFFDKTGFFFNDISFKNNVIM